MSGHESTYEPKLGITKWLDSRLPIVRLAHDSFVEKNGRIVPDYDIAITKAKVSEPPDLWAMFGALAHIPVLAIRGAEVCTASSDSGDAY